LIKNRSRREGLLLKGGLFEKEPTVEAGKKSGKKRQNGEMKKKRSAFRVGQTKSPRPSRSPDRSDQ